METGAVIHQFMCTLAFVFWIVAGGVYKWMWNHNREKFWETVVWGVFVAVVFTALVYTCVI